MSYSLLNPPAGVTTGFVNGHSYFCTAGGHIKVAEPDATALIALGWSLTPAVEVVSADGIRISVPLTSSGSAPGSSVKALRTRFVSGLGAPLGWQGQTFSNGTTQVGGTEKYTIAPPNACRNIQFFLLKGYCDDQTFMSLQDQTPYAPITYSLTWMDANNSNVFFNVPAENNILYTRTVAGSGWSQSIMNSGTWALTKPLGVSLAAGVTQQFCLYKTMPTGGVWPTSMRQQTGVYYNGDGAITNSSDVVSGTTGQTGTDRSTDSSFSFSAPQATAMFWGPNAIIGQLLSTTAAVGYIIGDSISLGVGSVNGLGYLRTAVNAAGGLAVNHGVGSSQITHWGASGNCPAEFLANYADYVLMHCGTNDFAIGSMTTLAQFQAQFLNAVNKYASPTRPFWMATIFPRVTGTLTAYATQVLPAWEAARVQINNWLRDKTSTGAAAYIAAHSNNLYGGTIDGCPALEVDANGGALVLDGNGQQAAGVFGRYKLGLTTDGTHPNATAVTALALLVPMSAINVASFP